MFFLFEKMMLLNNNLSQAISHQLNLILQNMLLANKKYFSSESFFLKEFSPEEIKQLIEKEEPRIKIIDINKRQEQNILLITYEIMGEQHEFRKYF